MSIGYRKILRDLWHSKGRTLLAVLSITIGVFAVGVVTGMNDFLPTNMTRSYRESNPAHLILYLNGTVDDHVVHNLTHVTGVAATEGVIQFGARWRPDANTPWRDVTIYAVADYTHQQFDRLELLNGQWPEARTLVPEHTTLESFNLPPSGSITLQIDDREHTVAYAGTIRDLQVYPPAFGGDAAFFASRDLVERLFGTSDFDVIKAQIPNFSQDSAQETLQAIKHQLSKSGMSIGYSRIQDPGRHFNQDLVDSVTLILGVLAILSLALGLFLVVNTINAIIAQQMPQIGVMKAVGAVTPQLLQLYLSGVAFYGALALLIAVPLGGLLAYALGSMLLGLLNVPPEPFRFSTSAVTAQIVVGLFAPLLAGLWPVLMGVRITVREAISSYGIGTGYGRGLFDRFISRIRGLPRPLALTLRNTFRCKGRVVLTQITLVTAGIVFIMVVSVNESFTSTLVSVYRSLGMDAFVIFNQNIRIEEAESIIAAVPGVSQVEMRGFRTCTALVHKDDLAGERVYVNGVSPQKTLFQPIMTQGRWLLPEDDHALVLNQKLLDKLKVNVGDKITIDMDAAGKSEWTIVGGVFDLSNNQTTAYVPRDVFLRDTASLDRASFGFIVMPQHDAAFQKQVADRLRADLEARGYHIGEVVTAGEQLHNSQNQFDILVMLLMVMSGLIALVGSIGLAGTLSINVLERRREIGVMRAIGASSFTVASLFVGEGLMLGLLAWLIAIPLSMPVGNLFAQAISGVIKFDVIYQFSWTGALTWLIIIVVLSILGSVLPAIRATRVSVRESLAYE
jgi:putative ABC transport system permease protein